jgi:hypothetical protein
MINEQILDAQKGDLLSLTQNIVEGVGNGEIDPVKMFIIARKMEELAKLLKGSLQSYIMDSDCVKTGQNKHFSCKIEQSSTGETYNLDENDEYRMLKAALKDLESKIKRASKNHESILDNETGELINPVSLKTPSKTVIKTTLY